MSGFWLKLIAMLTMLVDHVGAVFFPGEIAFRLVGRLAFPLFCFCVAEGMANTRSRSKYLSRLVIFAFLSEVPFDLALHGEWFDITHQNVIFTFVFAVLGIWLYEKPQLISGLIRRMEKDSSTYAYQYADQVVNLFALAACAGLAFAFRTDYDAFGVLLVYLFYFSRSQKPYVRAGLSAAAMIAYGALSSITGDGFSVFYLMCWVCAAASAILVALYNGKRGPNLKWLFYAFYPVHLLIIGLLSHFVLI